MIDGEMFANALKQFFETFVYIMSMPFPWIDGMSIGGVVIGVVVIMVFLAFLSSMLK